MELVKRREEASKVELEILSRKEKLAANDLLAGTSGGHVEPKKPEEIDNKQYAENVLSGKLNETKE